MATEPIQSGPYPVPADPPDGPNQMSAIVTWAAGRLVMRFASAAARTAALPNPTAGMLTSIGTGTALVVSVYNGADWQPVWSDSGWVNVVSAGAQTPNTVQVRKIGKTVVIRGAFNGAPISLSSASFTTLGTIPEGFAAPYPMLLPGSYSGASVLQFQIVGGVISVRSYSTASTTSSSPSLSIAGATWTTD